MKTFALLALVAPAAAFTTQNNVARQSTQISETKVRCVYAIFRLEVTNPCRLVESLY